MGSVGCGRVPAPPCLSSLLLVSALVLSVPTLARPPLWPLHVDVTCLCCPLGSCPPAALVVAGVTGLASFPFGYILGV